MEEIRPGKLIIFVPAPGVAGSRCVCVCACILCVCPGMCCIYVACVYEKNPNVIGGIS